MTMVNAWGRNVDMSTKIMHLMGLIYTYLVVGNGLLITNLEKICQGLY